MVQKVQITDIFLKSLAVERNEGCKTMMTEVHSDTVAATWPLTFKITPRDRDDRHLCRIPKIFTPGAGFNKW